jgi:DNA invertase Pin-like site-specific DNA recombinase
LLEIVARAKAKGAKVKILNLGNLNPCSVNGKLILTVLGAIAAFEREMMPERQREGIARAKAEGKYKGRKPTARNQANQVRALAAEGVSKVEIARRLGCTGRVFIGRSGDPNLKCYARVREECHRDGTKIRAW